MSTYDREANLVSIIRELERRLTTLERKSTVAHVTNYVPFGQDVSSPVTINGTEFDSMFLARIGGTAKSVVRTTVRVYVPMGATVSVYGVLAGTVFGSTVQPALTFTAPAGALGDFLMQEWVVVGKLMHSSFGSEDTVQVFAKMSTSVVDSPTAFVYVPGGSLELVSYDSKAPDEGRLVLLTREEYDAVLPE